MDIEWISKGLQKPGKTQRGLAKAMGLDPSGVNRILSGDRQIKASELPLILGYLEEPAPSIGPMPQPWEATAADIATPMIGTLPLNLPVYGVALGGPGDSVHLNGQALDYVRRPPGLALAPKAFGVYVQGESMIPRYDKGDLIMVKPGRPARIGDHVVIELYPTSFDSAVNEAGPAFVKRLVRKTTTEIICEQYNPADEIRYPADQVKSIYRIMTNSELFGAG